MASTAPTLDVGAQGPSRQQRVGRYKVWLLQKRFAELSAQVEASVLEARQLIAWKQNFQPLPLAELTDEDKRALEHNHRLRLQEVVQKHCSGALKTIMTHKWAFPFNSPVDTNRFPDYPKVVTQPMDFSTIRTRQDSGFYRDPKDWWADIMLVFSNAKRYNAPGSDCYLMAQTLQEVSEEKYEKVVAPRLAEEAAAMLRDEVALKRRRAELVNASIAEAMDAQCAMLFNLLAELHAAIREAKAMASSLCEPLTLEEKQALAATIQGLPTAQLESIVAFVASRHPPSVSQTEAPPGAGGPSRKVQLNLGKYDPLLLRQLQHLVGTCTAATAARGSGGGGSGTAAAQGAVGPYGHVPVRVQQQRVASPPATVAAAAKAAAERARSANASPNGSPGQAAAAAAAAAAAGAGTAAGSTAGGTTAPAAPAEPAAGTAAAVTADQGAIGQPAPAQGAAAGTGAPPASQVAATPAPTTAQDQAQTPAAAPGASGQVPAPAAAGAAGPASTPVPAPTPAPQPFSTQRNIADVVTNATAAGISQRAGIKWPGLAIGAGVRARSRALLSLHLDGPCSAPEVLAACPPPPQPAAAAGQQQAPPLPPPPQQQGIMVEQRGVKRRAADVQATAQVPTPQLQQ